MNIINLPIDVTVTKEVVEKRVVEEEGCLVLLRKKTATKHGRRTVFLKKGDSVYCSSLYSIVASTKV